MTRNSDPRAVRATGRPSRLAVLRVMPARAVPVYTFITLTAAAAIVFGVLLGILWARTQAVCEPLRVGEAGGSTAQTAAGKTYAETFGGAADKLACPPLKTK